MTVNLDIFGSFSQLFVDVNEAKLATSVSMIYGRVWVKAIFKSEFTLWLQEHNTSDSVRSTRQAVYVECNIEAGPCNHCCSVKSISIIIIIIIIYFMQGIYTYILETDSFPREYIVAAILLFLFMVPISLAPALALLCFYVSTFRSMCAVPNMAVLLLLLLLLLLLYS
jgi:hypothetical protein